jgi:hypothetical protein
LAGTVKRRECGFVSHEDLRLDSTDTGESRELLNEITKEIATASMF